MVIECTSGSFLKFVFIRAVITPIFDNPSHVGAYSILFSINNAQTSPTLRGKVQDLKRKYYQIKKKEPFFRPYFLLKVCATLFEYNSTYG
jgi:hypothetical protein